MKPDCAMEFFFACVPESARQTVSEVQVTSTYPGADPLTGCELFCYGSEASCLIASLQASGPSVQQQHNAAQPADCQNDQLT